MDDQDKILTMLISRLDRIEGALKEHTVMSHRDHITLIERITNIEQSRLTYSKITTLIFGTLGGILTLVASMFFKL